MEDKVRAIISTQQETCCKLAILNATQLALNFEIEDCLQHLFLSVCSMVELPRLFLTDIFINDIFKERERQDKLHNNDNLNKTEWTLILIEEIGEAIKEYNNKAKDKFYIETVQSAAVCVRILEEVKNGI